MLKLFATNMPQLSIFLDKLGERLAFNVKAPDCIRLFCKNSKLRGMAPRRDRTVKKLANTLAENCSFAASPDARVAVRC
jgi:hypothetical protein